MKKPNAQKPINPETQAQDQQQPPPNTMPPVAPATFTPCPHCGAGDVDQRHNLPDQEFDGLNPANRKPYNIILRARMRCAGCKLWYVARGYENRPSAPRPAAPPPAAVEPPITVIRPVPQRIVRGYPMFQPRPQS